MINQLGTAIVMLLVIGLGVYLTLKTNVIQVREFKRGWIKMLRANQSAHGLSSFNAAAIAIGGRIGTGNIAGVAFAIYFGGYGTIFWLWVVGFLGMATSFIETTLAQIYKEYDEEGAFISGPVIYISRGIGGKFNLLATLYGVLIAFTVGFMYIAIHTNTITTSILAFTGVTQNIALESFMSTVIALVAAYIIIGGTKKVGKVLAYIVPVMMLSYIVLVVLIGLENLSFIPEFYRLVISQAFTPSGVVGGSILSVITISTALSTLSNEAGLGTSTLAAGLANGSHPTQQGFVNMITIFIDVLVCTMTAFVIILALESGSIFVDITNTSELAMESFAFAREGGSIFLLMFIIVFTFTTLVTSITYGLQIIKVLMLNQTFRRYRMVSATYLLLVLTLIVSSPFVSWVHTNMSYVVVYASITMLLINLVAITKLHKVALAAYDHYNTVGHDFKSTDINVDYKDNVDEIWK